MMQIQVETTTRQILAMGAFPAGSPDPVVTIIDIPDAEALILSQPGEKYLNPDGTIRVDTTRLEQQQAEEAAAQQTATQAAATLKAQTLAAFVAEYRNLISIGASTFAAFGLYQSLRVAERDFGIAVNPATDLPADLQAGLASLPS